MTRFREHSLVALVLALFFLSGFAALLYQVVWQRMLTFFSGADLFSVTIAVGAFMAGLGLGSLAGGHIADSVSRRTSVVLFAVSELAIALFAFTSKWLFYDLLYGQFGHIAESPQLVSLVLFMALLWPTFFMGMSLPLLVKGLTTNITLAPTTIGRLYAVNTLGAAVGALATPWLLVRNLGMDGALLAGTGINLGCGLLAVGAVLLLREDGEFKTTPAPTVSDNKDTSKTAYDFRPGMWIGLYGLSGFIALSLEMVWFRVLGVMLKSNTFTFPTLLAHFLFGLALGSLFGIFRAARAARPARDFLMCQALVPVYAALSLTVFLHAVGVVPIRLLDTYGWYFRQYSGLDMDQCLAGIGTILSGSGLQSLGDETSRFFALYAILPALFILPATFLMGFSYPLLQKVIQTDTRFVGRRTGWLQTSNILGSSAGSFIGSFLLIRLLGSGATLALMAGLSGVYWILLATPVCKRKKQRRLIYGTIGLGLALLVTVVPGNASLWARVHGTEPENILFEEDGSGITLLRSEGGGDTTMLFINGLGQSRLPFGGAHTLLGALPAMMHPNPERIAIIGLGSGDTVYAAAAREESKDVTCVEILTTEYPLLDQYREDTGYEGLNLLFSDTRVNWLVGDGRVFVAQDESGFDIIEADPLQPDSAYAGNLYSAEYFTLLKDHLNPGGFAITWTPTPRVVDTFVSVFEYAIQIGDLLVVGSNQPIPFDVATIEERFNTPFSSAHFLAAEIDTEPLLRAIRGYTVQRFRPDDGRPVDRGINTDLRPRDEYIVPPGE